MDFAWSEEQLAYQRSVEEFAAERLNNDVVARDAAGEFDARGWQACADFGIHGLPVALELGGSGADARTMMLAFEALGFGCSDNGLLFSLQAHLWGVVIPLATHGTAEQQAEYLPALLDGSSIGAIAMTEPGAGSDPLAMRTTAVRAGERYVLNGAKTFVTNAPISDVVVVFARTDPAAAFMGITAFLVDRRSPGLTLSRPIDKMGLRTSPVGEVVMQDCEVAADRILGRVGGGWGVFNQAMDWERSFIMAGAAGTMRRQFERVAAYARERVQFGRPIGSFQAVSRRVVDLHLRVRTARLLLWELGWKRDAGVHTAADASAVKLAVSEAFVAFSLDALQVFGGYGYTTEYELERDVRDALAGRLYSGTSEMQHNIIAKHFGL